MKLDSNISAVITGGASGLGEATARALAAQGVKVGIFDLNEEKGEAVAKELGGVFALGLDGAIHLKDKQTAKYVLGLLDTAVSTIQRAYRSLNYNPLIEQLKNGSANQGAASPYQQAQLANLQYCLHFIHS